MNKSIVSLTIASLLASPVFAQENAQESAQQTDSAVAERITITASRTSQPESAIPATVTVIDGEELRKQLAVADSLSDLLGNLVPAFSPSRQKLTSSGETLRGREPLYLIDGVPQSNPLRNGARASYTIDPLMIERVEIIHGASAIQGMGASGGIINLVTKSATEGSSHEVVAGLSAPTSNTSEGLSYRTGYLFRTAEGNWDIVAGGHVRSTGMYVDGNGDLIGVDVTQGDVMDSESYDLFTKIGYQLAADQHLELMVNHFNLQGNGDYSPVVGDRDMGIATRAVEQPSEGDPAENEVTTATMTYRNANILGADLNWQLFSQDFSALYGGGTFATFQDPAFGTEIFDQSRNDSNKLGSRLTMNWTKVADSPVDLSAGFDYLRDRTFQELAQTGRKWVPETNFHNWAPFAQLRYQQHGLTVSGGVRYEYGRLEVDNFTTLHSYGSVLVEGGDPSFNELLANLGIVYEFTDSMRGFASFSEGFSMPDVGRVLRGINTPGLSVNSFLNLQPVIADNNEVGIEYRDHALTASLSYFRSDSDFGARLQADADGFFSVMRERTEIDGYEASARYALTNDISLGMSYAKTNGEYDSDGDQQVDTELGGRNIAPERLNLNWSQQWSPMISSRLQWNKLFDRNIYDGAAAINNFDGYHTFDLQLQAETRGYGIFSIGVENLTDEFYFTYYAQTAGADRTNYAGRGRTVSLNWQYAF
ncbi:TonB-dependent receptor [Pseudidiomarina salinarum]|uniref:TonB-dependent receptor n=1 Tax=Pseudidiomarina salinarum TaxID=435908 RepID=A0A094ITY8_9GAMM|nr:TonB-dependent receptor [Pseudidiomarina salinarum]KFZ31145.1 TonB-dependent receptor [Pseudidiomarina salinarum]RUO71227.1 TonB-dependent receptor [Pseudidiomarina salinarum]